MNRVILSLLVFFNIVMLQAQNKLDLQLIRMLNESRASRIAAQIDTLARPTHVTILAITRKECELPIDDVQSLGARVVNMVGRVATLSVPIDQLQKLSEIPEIESLNANGRHRIMCRNTREELGVSTLHSASFSHAQGFPQPYTGKGVMVGIIDIGIEYGHLNFRNYETGETRLKGAALYRPKNGAADSICEYYTFLDQLDTLTTDYPHMAHGTHTSGIAAGSYPLLQQQGMAPESDLMLCGTSVLEDDRLIDALQKIFSRADELDIPCVVNMSIGNPVGWKDGLSPFPLVCDALTDGGNKPGRAIVLSAGNDGEKCFSANLQFSDTLPRFSLLQPLVKSNKAWYYNPNIDLYCSDSLPVQLRYQLFDTLNHTFRELPIEQHLLDTLEAGHDNRRHLCLDIDTCDMSQYPDCLLAVQVKGQVGSSASLYYINNESVGYSMFRGADDLQWFEGTPDLSISDLCCSPSIISVGAYSAVDSLTNIFGRTLYPWSKKSDICSFSSYGILSDGTRLPDVIAPGTCVVSSYSSYYQEKIDYYYLSQRYLNSPMMYVIDDEDRSYYWTSDQGTSMSSPVVAGVIALWMQACPTLSVCQIREILQQTSRWDEGCQHAPGGTVQAGAGKIDAVAGMHKVLSMSGIEIVGPLQVPPTRCYNLQGQAVQMPTREGLYVVNGQLVHFPR